MKIQGKGDFSHAETVTLKLPNGETITAKLKVPGVDVGEMMLQRLPEPMPPRSVLRDGKKRPVVQDGQVLFDVDTTSKQYQAAMKEHGIRFGVATFVECLDDPTWEFDAERPADDAPNGAWAAYYKAIYDEMSVAQFPAVTFKAMAEHVKRISGIIPQEEARGFLPEGEETEPDGTDGGLSSKPPKPSGNRSRSSSSSQAGSKGAGSVTNT